MIQKKEIGNSPIDYGILAKRMLIGAAIALIPIILFLVTADKPNPAWPKFWMLRPLIIVPLAGAAGGVFYHLMDTYRAQGDWKKIMANVASVIVYVIGFWMGFVLGFDGTYWD